ncbi:uncharacterized protein LOC144477877, partial [Augochlora pura]
MPIELPQQRLPKYNGDPEKWDHFEDLFTSGVINNECLSDVQRLHYLNVCLEGRALAAISQLDITEDNFDIAWTTLKNDFGLPRFTTARLLDRLTKLKRIRKGDLTSLEQVTVGFKQAVAALEKRGKFEELWKWMLVHLIKLQLDDELEWAWETSLKLSKDYPSYHEVMTFLETHTRALTVMEGNQRRTKPESTGKTRIQTHNTVVQARPAPTTVCVFCGQGHDLQHCAKFLQLDTTVRWNYVKKSNCCTNCLATTHVRPSCRSPSMCQQCSERHHTLLHFSKSDRESIKKPAK